MGGRKTDPRKLAAIENDQIKFEGNPCAKCNTTIRYTKNGCCVNCQENRHRPDIYERSKRKQMLRDRYGITTEDYDLLLQEQSGVCKVCNKTCSTGRRLSVDHDHKTGKIRGLLCRNCNVALGYLGDNPLLFERCVLYLDGKL